MDRHEHFLALLMALKPGMRGLDVGCDCGGPSREMARFADVHITGVSINAVHVERAAKYAADERLSGLLDYVEADFMKLPFKDEELDFVYAMEATCHAPSLRNCYKEMARVLKPGGVFGTYEWFMTKRFDASIPRHLAIRQTIERGCGVTNHITAAEGVDAFRASGLKVIHEEDLAEKGDRRKWWFAFNGRTEWTTTWKDWWVVWRLKRGVWRGAKAVTWVGVRLGLQREGLLGALRTQGLCVYGIWDEEWRERGDFYADVYVGWEEGWWRGWRGGGEG